MTDNVPTTIEGFFLADYMRQREEIEDLRRRVEEYEGREEVSGYGCFDLHRVTACVRVNAASSYNYRREGMFTAEEIEGILAMDGADFSEWCTQTRYVKGSTSYYDKLTPISVEEHAFQYTLRFVESRSDKTLVTDGTANRTLIDLPDGPVVDCWVPTEYADESVKMAEDMARERLTEALSSLREEG